MKNLLRLNTLSLFLLIFSINIQAQQKTTDNFDAFQYRNFGAFRASAWVGSIAVPENPGLKHKYTWYVGARNGGIWKTINNGTTFECISDTFGTTAIGDIAVASSNPEIVWAGTGDAFNARSSYYGNGVWKSEDAGKTWQNMGLSDSHHISKIIIHPTNPEIVWVASMGHLFSTNEERGIFKTEDGGKNWKKVLYINEKTGVIDMAINPVNPNILFAASYQKERTAWNFEPGGEKSRIYKSDDSGLNWKILENGLPKGPLGRIGLDIHRSNPDIVVAVIQNLNEKPNADNNKPVEFDEFTDHSFDNLIGGEVYITQNSGENWERINDPETNDVSGKAAYSFNRISIDPEDPDKIYIIGASMYYTLDGGSTWPEERAQKLFQTNFGDNRIFWIDPKDPRHMMLGSDGGIYSTFDGGTSMNHYYHLPLGEVYNVEADNETPYNIYIGLQDHETWKAPSNGWSGEISSSDWVITGMWDGMYSKVDPENNKYIYITTQFGSHQRVNQETGERISISPKPMEGAPRYRYTWSTPLAISSHNSSIIYTGAQKVLRSLNRGETWEEISPDLTDNDSIKTKGKGHIQYCTITTVEESPLKAGIIWVGTDDGHVQLTTNFGHNWHDLTNALADAGAPSSMWVSRITASNFDPATAYISKCGYTDDIMSPYIFVTTNYGKTWKKITNGLPESPVNVIIEDKKNDSLLFAGNDLGVFVSLDKGQNWAPLKANMPTTVVRDLMIHPRENDLIVGTYGRAAWVTDISPLQQFSSEIKSKNLHLFDIEPKPQLNYSQQAFWGNYKMMGSNHLNTPNEENGLEIWYYLGGKLKNETKLQIEDNEGNIVFEKTVDSKQGFNKTYWNTQKTAPGNYKVILTNGNRKEIKTGRVLERWIWPVLNYSGKH